MNERLRVALVVTSAKTAKLFVFGFASFLAARGHDVHVITSNAASVVQVDEHPRVVLHEVPMVRDPAVLTDIRSLVAMVSVLRRVRPDVLAYATPKASLLASAAGFMTRVPVRIYQLWGLRLETASGLTRRVLALAERMASWCSTEILANSPSLGRLYQDLGLNGRRTVQVLGAGSSHGVDLDLFSPAGSNGDVDQATRRFLESSEGMVVGFVGRLHPDKGLDTLVRAAAGCVEAGTPIRLLLVGANEGAAPPLADAPWIHVVGAVDDTRPYYSAMDALVLVSRREGFPNVVLEAASMGIPTIVSDATGVVDSVVDGVTGIKIPVDDTAALAGVLLTLSLDAAKRELMGSAARAWADSRFRQKDVWDRHARYFELTIAAKGAREKGAMDAG